MPAEATFLAPSTIEEAVAALGRDDDAVVLAGGTSIGLLVGQGLLEPSTLVWLGRVDELRRLTHEHDRLVIGAGVTLGELAAAPAVRAHLPALAAAAAVVGNSRVRAVATLGGALAHADPRQDLPPVCLAYGAAAEVAGPAGRRVVPVDELVTGFMSTVLDPDEVITTISVPVVDGRRSVYCRYTPGSADDYPTVGVAATATVDDGLVTTASVAVGGAGPRAFTVPAAGDLVGRELSSVAVSSGPVSAVANAAAAQAEPVDDRLGSSAYKRAMVAVWVRRALDGCLGTGAQPTTGT